MITMYTHECLICKKKFESHKRVQKTCSISCRGKYAASKHTIKKCKQCGNPDGGFGATCSQCRIINKRKSRKESYYRNRDTIKKTRKEKYNNLTPEQKLANSRQMKERRFNGNRVRRLEHDSYQCQTCKTKENLVVHHLKPLPKGCTLDTWSQLEDLITLCRSCHIAIHREDLKSQAH